jgi:hypothetical protein
MKNSLRTGILLAFAVFIALTLGAARLAHVFSNKALLEEELQNCREDLEAVTAHLELMIQEGREVEGLAFFEESSKTENIGRWDCCYALCDTAGVVITPTSLAGKPLQYSVYQERPDGITLGTFSGHKVAVIRSKVAYRPYTVFGLYSKDYLLGDSHYMEGSYRLILLVVVCLLLLIAWFWVIPALEHIIERRQSAEETLALARRVQLKAVTQEFPSDERIDAYAILNPMYNVGGDIYGCQLEGNKLCFVIGDVSGKGIEASFLMFMVSSLVYPAFKRGHSPAQIASRLNDLICDNRDYDMFCTLLLGTIDLDTRQMEYCNAGHTKSLLDGTFLPQVSNFVLGGFHGFEYKSQTITLPHGSRLVFYTDGVTEARNEQREFYGEHRLLEWASRSYGTARETCESLREEVSTFQGKAPQNDDIAIMTIQIV